MARYGFLYCVPCKEEIFLGKWLRTEANVGIGFWHGLLCREGEADGAALGRKALRFLARHMDHELLVASDEGGKADALIETEEYRDVDDFYDAWARE